MQDIKDLNNYLKAVNKQYGKKGTINDVLNNFRLLSPEYQKLSENSQSGYIQYSSINLNECDTIERESFKTHINFESVVCNSIYDKHGIMYTWPEIIDLMVDPIYKNVEKIQRKVIFSSKTQMRPIGDNGVAQSQT